MIKAVTLFFLSLFFFSCENVLNNLDQIDDSETPEPYTTGEVFTVSYIQNHSKSLHIQIKENERLLSERFLGEATDAVNNQKTTMGTITLPNETKSYSIIDQYTSTTTTLDIQKDGGKYIYITTISSGLFAYQSETNKTTGLQWKT